MIVWSFDIAGGQPQVRQTEGVSGPRWTGVCRRLLARRTQVASAGYDKRVLIWQPDKIEDVDLKQLVANAPLAPQDSRRSKGIRRRCAR